MTPEERNAFREEIRFDVKEAIHVELGAYKVPKEQHYKDHIWIDEMRAWHGQIRNSILKSVVGVIITALAGLLLFGFIFWTKRIK